MDEELAIAAELVEEIAGIRAVLERLVEMLEEIRVSEDQD